MFTSLSPSTLFFYAPVEEALQLAHDNGFAGLDLSLGELRDLARDTSIQHVKDLFAAAGVRPGGWILPVEFRTSEEIYHSGLAELPELAQLAQSLGSPWCGTWILPASDELDYAANRALHIQRLQPIAQILADHGCRFGLESVGPQMMRTPHKYEFIWKMQEVLELGNELKTGNTGLLLDCFHLFTAHDSISDIAHLSAEQIVYVHVNDGVEGRSADDQIDQDRMLPGTTGVIDITSFLQTIHRAGYDGPVVVEPFNAVLNTLPPHERVRLTGESLRNVWKAAGLDA